MPQIKSGFRAPYQSAQGARKDLAYQGIRRTNRMSTARPRRVQAIHGLATRP